MDELKLLVSKGWCPYTLRDWWDYFQAIGIRNINCDGLRRIGKTQTLRSLIEEYYLRAQKQELAQPHIPSVIVHSASAKAAYMDLYKANKIQYIILESELENGRYRGFVNSLFSDEVPAAVYLTKTNGFGNYYIGGFYSYS